MERLLDQDLLQRLYSGDRRIASRLITLVEQQHNQVPQLLQAIHPHTGQAYCIGVTGPPGCGKSTLVDGLTLFLRQEQKQVGILAVDPTSPYSGGAVLGDRIRMQRHYLDSGVFIRSMASRGNRGGVATALRWAVQVLDAAGKESVLVETIGAGQGDVDVSMVADTVVVVLVPEAGDAIQTMKAGLMEIADIFVVNKADRGGALAVVRALKAMLALGKPGTGWQVPVITTKANQGVGVKELHVQIQRHREYLESSSQLEAMRSKRRRQAFLLSVQEALHVRIAKLVQGHSELADLAQAVELGELDPLIAAQKVVRDTAMLSLLATMEEE